VPVVGQFDFRTILTRVTERAQLACMSEQARAELKKMLDLLSANVWLELDEISFPRFFDGPLERHSEALQTARSFAEQNGAVLVYFNNPRVAKFGRAKQNCDA
jgi:hypothetical protein